MLRHTYTVCLLSFLVALWSNAGYGSSFMRFPNHTRRTKIGRTPLDEWSARRRHLYVTTHDTHKRQTSMPTVGLESAIPASERPRTYALIKCVCCALRQQGSTRVDSYGPEYCASSSGMWHHEIWSRPLEPHVVKHQVTETLTNYPVSFLVMLGVGTSQNNTT
jgi:hypothetical protein